MTAPLIALARACAEGQSAIENRDRIALCELGGAAAHLACSEVLA
jgi:hypothetical protein